MESVWSGRGGTLVAAVAVIAAGLALRRFGYDFGLPFVVVKYGGSVLWGAMVYLLFAAVTGKSSIQFLAGGAALLAIAVELSRLYHSPWLDEFRLTASGALLLGRVFSLWNILAYLIGIAIAAAINRRLKQA